MFDRFGQVRFEAFPLAEHGLERKWKGLAAAQDGASRLIGEYQRAANEVQALENRRADAREQDLQADSLALQAGGELPEPKALPALEAKITAALRTRDAFERAASEAVSKVHALRTEHAAALGAALQAALGKKAAKLAEHARQAAVLYGELEAGQQMARRLAPPPPPPSMEGQPARNTQLVIGIPTSAQMRGPNRGDVEATLAYLAGLAVPANEQQQGAA